MRPVLTTFIGVLAALLVYAGIRYAISEVKQSEIEKAAQVAEEDRMAIESERSKWAANWEWVQSAEDLLEKEGRYKAAMDFSKPLTQAKSLSTSTSTYRHRLPMSGIELCRSEKPKPRRTSRRVMLSCTHWRPPKTCFGPLYWPSTASGGGMPWRKPAGKQNTRLVTTTKDRNTSSARWTMLTPAETLSTLNLGRTE